jgi:imidazolonepropionase-like amidohydrolase
MSKRDSIVLRGGKVWDGRVNAATDGEVAVDAGVIAEPREASAAVLDISGCTVIPGLIEGHAHLCFNGESNWRATFDSDDPYRMAMRMATAGKRMLDAGITTVRDLGAPTDAALAVREAFRDRVAPGPELLVAGAPITTTGGHCHFMGGEADGELEIRKAVRQRVKAGCDWIKVMATGGNMTPRTNVLAAQYTVEELCACVEEAHRLNRRVAAHCHGTAGIRNAVAAGVDTLEHCSFTGANGIDRDDELIATIASAGTIVSPTISIGYRTWTDDGRRKQRAELLREMVRQGCRISMSTDCGIPGVPHDRLAEALVIVQEMTGLKAAEVLKLATSRSAELLGLHDRGELAPGKRADLVVVEGDPTLDLSSLQRVRHVFKGGQQVR